MRPRDAGFTLTELMLVVVILGVLAAIAAPRFTRDQSAAAGREFANEIAKELQRARMQAVVDRNPVAVSLFPGRIELRNYQQNARLEVTATLNAVALRQIPARPGVSIWKVATALAPPTGPQALGAAPQFQFNSRGGVDGDLNRYIYVHNDTVPTGHPEQRFRIDVQPLTGYVQLRSQW